MRVLVTGGLGFIGSRVRALLEARGHQWHSFDVRAADGSQHFSGEITDVEALKAAADGCDAIIHLAAAHRDDVRPVSEYTRVNIEGTAAVVEVAKALEIQTIVFASSVAVYGLNAGTPTESATPAPFNEYGRTKLEAEGLLREWFEADASVRSLGIVRPSVVFGEGNRGNVYTLARQVASKTFLMIGDGRNKKSMAYVENVAAFLLFMLDRGPGLTLANYADKPDLTTASLIKLITTALAHPLPKFRVPYRLALVGGALFDAAAKATGRTFPISRVRIEKFAAETTIATERARDLGFVAEVELPAALERTVRSEFTPATATTTTPSTPTSTS